MKNNISTPFASTQINLNYKPTIVRNIGNRFMTALAALFSLVAVLPLILVLGYVLLKGASKISISLFTDLPPGLGGSGIGHAVLGTFVVTLIAAMFAIPVGVGGGIYLAEYSRSNWVARFVRFGTNVLSGVPSIIAGVFIYGTFVASKVLFGNYWANLSSVDGLFEEIATLSVLIYNFSIQPGEVQNELAWASSFILVVLILSLNLFARWLGRFASR